MKIILSIFFSCFLFQVHGQMKPVQHFVLSSPERSMEDCSFELDCECCYEDLVLFDNGHFYQIKNCENTLVFYGSYTLQEEVLDLFYARQVISEIPAEKRTDLSSYSQAICLQNSIKKLNERYRIEPCGESQKIISPDQKQMGFSSPHAMHMFEEEHAAYRPLLEWAYCHWLSERNWQKEYPHYTLEDAHAFAQKGIDLLDCNRDFYTEEEVVFDSQSRGGYHDYKISYAADSTFRILTFIGEDCGAHCNGLYTNLVQFEKGKWEPFQGAEVDQILSFRDSLYIIHSTAQWTGTMGGTSKGLHIVKKEKTGFTSVPISPVITDSTSMLSTYFGSAYETYEFRVYNLWFQDEPTLEIRVEENQAFLSYAYYHNDSNMEDLQGLIPPKLYEVYAQSAGSLFLKIKGSFTISEKGIIDFKEEYELQKESEFMWD